MTNQPDPVGQAGLQFFGRMSASISHELKNVLAIIKENSGLLNDYLAMMARGRPVDPERFQIVGNRIEAQTRRADAIIKNLNQFAHTVDHPSSAVDLNQALELLMVLHQRMAAMHQVTLEPVPSQDPPVVVTTSPFLLLNALGSVLAYALKSVPAGQAMSLEVISSEAETGIGFGLLKNLGDRPADEFPDAQGKVLLDAVGARMRKNSQQGRIVIGLPRQ